MQIGRVMHNEIKVKVPRILAATNSLEICLLLMRIKPALLVAGCNK